MVNLKFYTILVASAVLFGCAQSNDRTEEQKQAVEKRQEANKNNDDSSYKTSGGKTW